jgi:D-amino-acid oxidase
MLQKLCENTDSGCMLTKGFELSAVKASPWFSKLIPEFKQYTNDKGQHVMEYETVCIDVPVYLAFLSSLFEKMGGIVRVQVVNDISNLWSDSTPDIVVNCSGIGARFLGGVMDEAVYPTRGLF